MHACIHYYIHTLLYTHICYVIDHTRTLLHISHKDTRMETKVGQKNGLVWFGFNFSLNSLGLNGLRVHKRFGLVFVLYKWFGFKAKKLNRTVPIAKSKYTILLLCVFWIVLFVSHVILGNWWEGLFWTLGMHLTTHVSLAMISMGSILLAILPIRATLICAYSYHTRTWNGSKYDWNPFVYDLISFYFYYSNLFFKYEK